MEKGRRANRHPHPKPIRIIDQVARRPLELKIELRLSATV